MSKIYRAAVIGLGRMGSTFDDEMVEGGCIFLPYCHAPSYAASPRIKLVAGADPHDGQREAFGLRWGLSSEHLYANYQEMLEKEALDLVSVCTTAKWRAEIVNAAARAGVLGIWAEKPISISLEEADSMVEVCREKGVKLAINCARRWSLFFMQAKALIDAGEIGEVLQVNGFGSCGLSHNGSHLLDAVRYFAGGKVSWVFGEMTSDEAATGEKDLPGNGYLVFDNGVRAFVRAMSCGVAEWEFEVIGSKGGIRLYNNAKASHWRKSMPGVLGGRSGSAFMPLPLPKEIPGTGIMVTNDIIAAIENGGQPLCSAEDGREALEVAIALRESHRQGGRRIDLPLADRSLRILSSETLSGDEPARVRREKAAARK